MQLLTRKNNDFDEECVESFELLKQELASPPVLCVYNSVAETELHSDASSMGFEAILLQKQESGRFAPIAYFSKATTEVERKYHSYKLETLAVVRAVERFHVYLQGITFRIVTDCNALVMAMKKINLNPRIARWSLALQNYKYELLHRPGGRMVHVDCLSRNVMMINARSLENELMYRQLSDCKLKEIAEKTELHGSDHFVIIDGLLFRNYKERKLFVVPEDMVNNVLRIHHNDMGHVGWEKTAYGILGHYWFPCVKLKVRKYIENCVQCLTTSIPGTPEGEMQIVERELVPFLTLHVDHFGPLERTRDGFQHILVIVDSCTRFVWLYPTKSTGTSEVIQCLTALFSVFGFPKRLISDRGTAFTSQEFAKYMRDIGVYHVQTAVASPWANGLVERVNRFLKSTLAKTVNENSDWKGALGSVQHVINNTLSKAIGYAK